MSALLFPSSILFFKTRKTTMELIKVKTQYNSARSCVQNILDQYRESVKKFEETVLPQRIFSPGKRLRQNKIQNGDLILVDTNRDFIENYEGVVFDLSLTPEAFDWFTGGKGDSYNRFVLCRYDEENGILKRWKSYWH